MSEWRLFAGNGSSLKMYKLGHEGQTSIQQHKSSQFLCYHAFEAINPDTSSSGAKQPGSNIIVVMEAF